MKRASPLRYPGGKSFLAVEFARILEKVGLHRPVYVEPYAGGAGAALSLLFADKVSSIVINDRDRAIFSFWLAARDYSEKFAEKIRTVPLTVAQWRKQRKIYENKFAPVFDRGFATFYLNRTNRSGVMNAWPIGGIEQTGNYLIDARFNRDDLASRILKVGEYADRIVIRDDDGIALTKEYIDNENTFIYLDPPYYKKGAMLYMSYYKDVDHEELAKLLNENADSNWLLTYDERAKIRDLYDDRVRRRLKLSYRVHDAKKAHELMIFSDRMAIAR